MSGGEPSGPQLDSSECDDHGRPDRGPSDEARHPDGGVDLRLAAGEYLAVPERLIVSPMPGRFEPSELAGDRVEAGQAVGAVVRSGERIEVLSQVSGRFMGHLADHGERVRDGQALAWVRLAG